MTYDTMMTIAKQSDLNNYQDCINAITFVKNLFCEKMEEERILRDKNNGSKFHQKLLDDLIVGFCEYSSINREVWEVLEQAETEGKLE